jgi:glycosyltransferase involved in cell wall biosynthesis
MKIAILTTFMGFPPGYSLTGIVKDQVKMLTKYGHEVYLFVSEKFDQKDEGEIPPEVHLVKKIPFTHQKDYQKSTDITPEHLEVAKKMEALLVEELKDINVIFTHDLLFIGWYYPYGLGCIEASKKLPDARWLHWVHSVPTNIKDWWDVRKFGPNHKLVYPNDSDKIRLAEAYRGTINDVRTIPHIKDIRTFFEFNETTCDFIDRYPGIMQADVVQIYPCSVDRLDAKRLDMVIKIFGGIKKLGHSVCLVVVTQWATGQKQRDEILKYKQIAFKEKLTLNEDIVFTSDYSEGKYGVAVPHNILRELWMCSNLFVFPTREESFGLVLPEASLASGCLCVLNKSLDMQVEISGFCALYFDFGSYFRTQQISDLDKYCMDLATIITGRIAQNESLMTKTFMRKRYNMDHLYAKYYAPIMAETRLW